MIEINKHINEKKEKLRSKKELYRSRKIRFKNALTTSYEARMQLKELQQKIKEYKQICQGLKGKGNDLLSGLQAENNLIEAENENLRHNTITFQLDIQDLKQRLQETEVKKREVL